MIRHSIRRHKQFSCRCFGGRLKLTAAMIRQPGGNTPTGSRRSLSPHPFPSLLLINPAPPLPLILVTQTLELLRASLCAWNWDPKILKRVPQWASGGIPLQKVKRSWQATAESSGSAGINFMNYAVYFNYFLFTTSSLYSV
jgi:hypothetical protein